MKNSPEISAKNQIRNLLIVISSGVVFALAIAALMLGSYGPTGRYLAHNVLLSPETAKIMSYEGQVFDHVEFSNWNSESKVWNKQKVTLPLYQKFYALIDNDHSLQEVSSDVVNIFSRTPAALTLFVRSDTKKSSGQAHSFQVLQFAQGGDYYRVELRTDGKNDGSQWVYFHHVGLADQFLDLLVQERRLQ